MTLVLADLKAHLGISLGDTSQDAKLQTYLDAAVETVEAVIGPITPRTITETHYGHFGGTLFLFQGPVISVESVANLYGPYSMVGLSVDTGMGALRTLTGYAVRGDVTVTYTAGRATIPALVREVVLDLARLRYQSRVGGMPPGVDVAEEDPTPRFSPNDGPILARLAPYRRDFSVA